MALRGRSILIVDDNPALRTALSVILSGVGYHVHSAGDGFAALAQIRLDMPDLILSDLNMPGMSGYELLSIVRRRFPSIVVIAISGAYRGDEIPSGIAADAFYAKGRGSIEPLLQLVTALLEGPQPPGRSPSAPIWIPQTRFNAIDEGRLVVTCPECLRTFPQQLRGSKAANETHCQHCSSPLNFVLVQSSLETDLTAIGSAAGS